MLVGHYGWGMNEGYKEEPACIVCSGTYGALAVAISMAMPIAQHITQPFILLSK